MAVSLTRISRKLRKKTGFGLVKALGTGETARIVLERWEKSRDENGDDWLKNYENALKNADVETGKEKLTEWYNTLGKYSDELREVILPIYNKIKAEYRPKREKYAKRVAERITVRI